MLPFFVSLFTSYIVLHCIWFSYSSCLSLLHSCSTEREIAFSGGD